jgi:hypothetical protein
MDLRGNHAMGIIAYCPNDHRVKVKDALAGKKGICPTCGARFRIPFESQPDRKHVAIDDTGPAEDLFEPPAQTAVPAPAAPPLPATAPVLAPVSVPPPAPAAAEKLSATGLPIAEIVSFDANLAASLPRAMPLATSR